MRRFLARFIDFDPDEAGLGEPAAPVEPAAPAADAAALPPPNLEAPAPLEPAEPAAPAADPRLDDIEEGLRQVAGFLAHQEQQRIAQANAGNQGVQLPEWDPYDAEVVKAYNQAWLGESLGPVLQRIVAATESFEQTQGETRFSELMQATKASLPAELPGYVRDNFDDDLALRLGAPYLHAGADPGQTFGFVAEMLTAHDRAVGDAAVAAYRASLAAADAAVSDPPAGGIAGIVAPSVQPQDGESVYRAAMRASMSRQAPVTP